MLIFHLNKLFDKIWTFVTVCLRIYVKKLLALLAIKTENSKITPNCVCPTNFQRRPFCKLLVPNLSWPGEEPNALFCTFFCRALVNLSIPSFSAESAQCFTTLRSKWSTTPTKMSMIGGAGKAPASTAHGENSTKLWRPAKPRK